MCSALGSTDLKPSILQEAEELMWEKSGAQKAQPKMLLSSPPFLSPWLP
jgi:hypothetical protein